MRAKNKAYLDRNSGNNAGSTNENKHFNTLPNGKKGINMNKMNLLHTETAENRNNYANRGQIAEEKFEQLKVAVSKLPVDKFANVKNPTGVPEIGDEACTNGLNLLAVYDILPIIWMENELNEAPLDYDFFFSNETDKATKYEYSLDWALDAATGDDEAKKSLLLGILYNNGVLVKPNSMAAMKYFEEAAIAGNPIAMYRIGQSYSSVFGLPHDRDNAIMYLEKAKAAGVEFAEDELDRIYEEADYVCVHKSEGWIKL